MDIICYEIFKNGMIKFYGTGDEKVSKFMGYTLAQAKKQYRIDNGLQGKYLEFINLN